jgi:hypothetical protein
MVRGTVEDPLGKWTFRDPCLTTFEVEQLAGWFESVAEGEADGDSGYFTEPNRRFEFISIPTPAALVTFAHESGPPWMAKSEKRLEGVAIGFPTSLNEPRESARSLRAMLARYPIRLAAGNPA